MTDRDSLMEYGSWPSAVLFCVRHPLDHTATYRPMENYPIASRSGVLGPIRGERCGDCGALMYVAAGTSTARGCSMDSGTRIEQQPPGDDRGSLLQVGEMCYSLGPDKRRCLLSRGHVGDHDDGSGDIGYSWANRDIQSAHKRIAELSEALQQAIQVIEWCGLNDKTPGYNYGEPRKNGDVPGAGKTFNTPREFASWWPDRLRAVLGVAE